ncbi:MAG: hypothetical protein ABIE22_04645 [archaeon]
MKKEAYRVLGILLISVIMISLLAGIVAAAPQTTLGAEIASWFSGLGGASTQTKETISKVLLTALVIVLVYSIASFLPFFPEKQDWIKWIFAAIVGVLSFMFVGGEDIQFILTNYEALGIMLTSIIPLAILLAFSWQIHTRYPESVAMKFLIKLLLAGFVIYLIFRWFTLSYTVGGTATSSAPILRYVYPITIIAALLWLAFEKKAWRMLRKAETATEIQSTQNVELERALARMDDLKQRLGRAPNKGLRTQIERDIEKQKEAIDALQRSS